MNGFPGECFRCPRPGQPVTAMCVHGHEEDIDRLKRRLTEERERIAYLERNCGEPM